MPESSEIDLTPPADELKQQTIRYLVENFERIQRIIAVLDAGQGITDTFTTADAKTVTVVDGIVTSIV